MRYKIGEKIPDGEAMLRRVKVEWINSDNTISSEAFRPRKNRKGKFENGVSVDLERFLLQPVGDDYWSNERKMATCRFLSDIVNATPAYDIVYNGPSPSHCIITGDMSALFKDELTLSAIAEGARLIHVPFD